ncbi:ABC-2 type transport system ATP-binding protein [Serinibacter salmoneus]|uniref:ABC-2 type transport system ATP-binding protein n=1 Tax=Serinibacter salmoneus TaxID=556530 RepID=A0A2A9CZ78_9MICO|nr:ABC-2 type transport system ATP-binding protein [Serinibacter salmoneus]
MVLEGIHLSYREVSVLNGVDLELRPGITALLGVNGAGKTTLMNIAAGSLRPDRGLAAVVGQAVYRSRSRRRALRHVAMMPQGSSFPGNLTAHETVRYIAWMRGMPPHVTAGAATDALDRVGLAAESSRKIRRMSGGMRRRVALAQAIVSSPSLLLLDEPSTGLDPEQRHGMVALVRQLGGTVLLSSHVMEDVRDLADRVLVLHRGSIRFDGTVAELERYGSDGNNRATEEGFLAVINDGPR